MTWWIWLLFGLALLVVELVIPGGFYLLFFGCGAIAVGLLTAAELAGPPWMQWLMFSALSVVAMLLFRRPLLEKLRPRGTPRDVDSLAGQVAIALEPMEPGAIGRAELRGTHWSARNVGPTALTPGQRCLVKKVDGLTLFVTAE